MDNYITSFKNYLQLEKNYSKNTVTAYIDDVNAFCQFLTIEKQFVDISTLGYSDIRLWIINLVEAGLENVTINRKMASLKSFFKFLLKINAINCSPLVKHKALKASKILQVPFSEKEMNDAFTNNQFSTDFDGIRDQLMLEMFYTTGIRRVELINILTYNIDLHSNIIKVVGKRNKERIIPLLPVIIEKIKLYKAEKSKLNVVSQSDFFFITNKGLKLNESFVYRKIKSYLSTVSEKVKKSPHMLRHSYATHLLNNGADLNSVKELLGHSSLASTQVYTQSSLSELKNVFSRSHPRGN